MLAAFCSSFILEHDFLALFLPVVGSGSHALRNVPVFVSRDMNADPLSLLACAEHAIDRPPKAKLTKAQREEIAGTMKELYHRVSPNWHAVYPWAPGCSHTKLAVVRYPGFLLLMITSCNFMAIDMVLSDNTWYIQTFPELPNRASKKRQTPFEQHLLHHLDSLDCPDEFIDSIARRYDFSAAEGKVHLVASEPGVKNLNSEQNDAKHFGLFRLGALAQQLIPQRKRRAGRIELETCTGSPGTLDENWVKKMDWVVKGGDVDDLSELWETSSNALSVPSWTIVFPTKDTVNGCSEEVKTSASNIGCSLTRKLWPEASPAIRGMFHDYLSKDAGRLFHQKLYIWLDKDEPHSSKTPRMIYAAGSHNLSKAAWRAVEFTRRGCGKLTNASNFELGVVVKGKDVASMLEPGSTWEDLITYERPSKPYGEDDLPWNSPAWVKDF